MATTYQPKGRPNLYIRYRVNGAWKSKASQWRPGQEAEALAEGRALETAAGTAPEDLTVSAWADRWLNERSGRVRDWRNDRQRWRDHIEPVVGDMPLAAVQPRHILAVVHRLQAAGAAPRTVRNVYSVAKALFRDAAIEGLCSSQPCILTARQLGHVKDANLGWRAGAVFSRAELEKLYMDPRIPLFRRVLWGLLGIGGLRDGEACALRWGRLQGTKPLARIVVAASHERDETKTGAERWMPVHEALQWLLEAWRGGWRRQVGRPYGPDDLVLPAPKATNRGPRKREGAMLDKNWIWKRLQADLHTLGLRPRRAHDMRRTLISLAREDGADANILRRGTHAPSKDIMSLYTSVDWRVLCREVAKLKLVVPYDLLTDNAEVRAYVKAVQERRQEDEVEPRPF